MPKRKSAVKTSLFLKPVYLLALLTVGALCSGYLLMFAVRSVHQSHYPQLASQWANDGSFSVLGMYWTETGHEELGYATRVQEASDHWAPSDPFLLENRSKRILLTGYIAYRVMGLVHLLVGDIGWTWFVLRCLCSFAWVLLLYHLALRFKLPEDVALFTAVFVACQAHLFTMVWFSNIMWFGELKQMAAHNLWSILSFGRTELLRMPRPAVTYPSLFLAALLNVKTAHKQDLRSAAISGIWGGLLAYIRMDVWSSYLAATFIFAAVYAYKKKKISWPLVWSALASFAVSIPWFSVYLFADSETLVRAGVSYTDAFDYKALVYLAAFAVVVRRSKEPMHWFGGCILASVFMACNIQLVTGFSFFSFLWKNFGNIFFFLALLSFLPRRWLQKEMWWRGATACVLFVTAAQSISYGAIHYQFYGIEKNYEAALEWVDANTPKDAVFLALNPEATFLLATRTGAKTFIASGSTPLSDHRTIDNVRRLVVGLRLLGADRDRFLDETVFNPPVLKNARRFTRRGLIEKVELGNAYFLLHGTKEMGNLLKQIDAESGVPILRLDYVWIGDFEREYLSAAFPKDAGAVLEEVYRNPGVALYKVASLTPTP